MSKRDERLFNPVRVRQKGSWKLILAGFLAFTLIFGGAVFVYLSSKVDGINIDKIMSVFEKDDGTSTLIETQGKQTNILFLSVSSTQTIQSGKQEIYFMVLGKMGSQSKEIKFLPLQVKDSYLAHFEKGGANELTQQVAKEYGIEIHRYVSSNENTFALAVNYMDGLEFNVPERVEYRTEDLTLILTPGKQTIKGESLLKYLKYYKEQSLTGQGELFCAMVEDYFTQENMHDPMKIYKGVLAEISGNSNITFVDCADNLDILKAISESTEKKAVYVNSIEAFR